MPVLPRAANPAVPAALEAVVMKAMAKDPDDRYGSAEELRADLLRFADGRPVEAADPGVTSMMATVGATQAVPTTTGRTMAVPADAAVFANRDDLERQKRTRRLIVLLVLLLVALGVIAFFLLRSLGGNVTVPNVVGQQASLAAQTLQNDNLTVGTTTRQASTSAKGTVLSTNPAAGASVGKHSAVNLVVSNGPNVPTVTVPSVKGKQLATAIQLIQAAGLTYKVKDTSSTQPVGTVLDQSPAGGAKVKATVPVQLTVSSTQTSVSVPSVIGQSPASAGSVLQQAGLNVGNQSNACSNQVPQQGLVSSQSPAAGTTQPPNTPVNLVISNGPCVSVPNVVGQSSNAAQSAITSAGLVANTTFDTGCANDAQPGNVDSQDPAQGAQVSGGTTVNISVCQAAATTTTTTTAPSTTTSTTSLTPPTHVRAKPGA